MLDSSRKRRDLIKMINTCFNYDILRTLLKLDTKRTEKIGPESMAVAQNAQKPYPQKMMKNERLLYKQSPS